MSGNNGSFPAWLVRDAAIVIACLGGAVWLGSLQHQVHSNSERLANLEARGSPQVQVQDARIDALEQSNRQLHDDLARVLNNGSGR